MANSAEQLRRAENHRRAGRLREAAQILTALLRAQPQHVEALNLMALTAHQMGTDEHAANFIGHALALRPEDPGLLRTKAEILRGQGKLDEAIETYRHCLYLNRTDFVACYNVGNLLSERGRLPEAVGAYQTALQLDPRQSECHHNLGRVLERLGQRKAAKESYRAAIRLRPDANEARVDLANMLAAEGKFEAARALYVQALRYDERFVKGHINLGSLLSKQGKFKAAATSYRQALRIDPRNAQAWNNMGNLLLRVDRLEQARKCYGRAIELDPRHARAYYNRGNLHVRLRQLDDALADFDAALTISPGHAEAHVQRARLWLLKGDLQRGWTEYEWRPGARLMADPRSHVRHNRWDGSDPQGKVILLYTENELSEMLHMVRYAALLKQRGASVVLGCPADCAEILSRCDGVDRVVTSESDSPKVDACALLASVPRILQSDWDTIPATVPYVRADPDGVAACREELGASDALQVGIAWQTRRAEGSEGRKPLSLDQFIPLAGVPGIRLVSVQETVDANQLARVQDQLPLTPLPIHSGPQRGLLVDAAAAIANLDLVITPDLPVAHLAGALGAAVWVILPYVPDWRWLLDRDDSPWYPTMRLFRQPSRGDWHGVMQQVKESLASWAASRNTP